MAASPFPLHHHLHPSHFPSDHESHTDRHLGLIPRCLQTLLPQVRLTRSTQHFYPLLPPCRNVSLALTSRSCSYTIQPAIPPIHRHTDTPYYPWQRSPRRSFTRTKRLPRGSRAARNGNNPALQPFLQLPPLPSGTLPPLPSMNPMGTTSPLSRVIHMPISIPTAIQASALETQQPCITSHHQSNHGQLRMSR